MTRKATRAASQAGAGVWRSSAIVGPANRRSGGSWPTDRTGRSSMPISRSRRRRAVRSRAIFADGGEAGLPRLGGTDPRRADSSSFPTAIVATGGGAVLREATAAGSATSASSSG